MPETLVEPLKTKRSEIEYYEHVDGYQEHWADDNSHIIRRFACLWDTRKDFILDVLGDAKVSAGKLRRDLPEEDKDFPGYYALDMHLVHGAGQGRRDETTKALRFVDVGERDSSNQPTQGYAVYDVTFRRPVYDVKSDEDADNDARLELSRYVVRNSDVTADALSVPGQWLKYGDPAITEPIGQAAPVLFPKRVLTIDWWMVPDDGYPEQTVTNMVGKVNSQEFENHAAGKLLFLGDKKRLYQAANTRNYWHLQYYFELRPQGYNKFFVPSVDAFKDVVRIANTAKGVFEADQFKKLFDVSQP